AAIDEMRAAVKDTFLAVGNRAMVAGKAAFDHIRVATTTAQKLEKTVEKLTMRSPRATAKAAPVPLPSRTGPVDTDPGPPAREGEVPATPAAAPAPATPTATPEPTPKAA